jgi:hypothetical protein
VILYELIAGCPPFRGDTAATKLAAVLRDDPEPLESRATEAPKRLLRLVFLCLRKNPEERYQSITDVKFALEELKEDLEGGQADAAQPVHVRLRRRVMVGAALAAGLAGLLYIALQLRRNEQPPITLTPLTMYDGFADSPALSPDGKMVAFTWGGDHQDNIDVYVKVAGSGEPIRVTTQNPVPAMRPIWSHDGRSIAFSRFNSDPPMKSSVSPNPNEGSGLATATIYTVPVLGGPEKMVGRGFASDWSPDGSTLLALFAPTGEPTAWMLVSAADGSARRLTNTPPGSRMVRGRFSPDGRKVYYIEQTGPGESRLNEIDVAGGAPKPVPIAGLRTIDSFAMDASG